MSDAFEKDGMTVALRDRSRILVRQVRHDDRALLLEGFGRLRPKSRYKRFLGPMPRLSETAIDYLLDIDHRDHEALAAIDPATGAGVGLARYVRLQDRPDTAEAAVAVVDDWQGRGVGTILLDLLVDRAREEGVVRFTSLVLADNREMLELLESLGPARVVDRQLGTVTIESELPLRDTSKHLRPRPAPRRNRSSRVASAG